MIAAMRDDRSVVELVERARDGDKTAWDQIVERYAVLVWSVCRRHNLSGADADDVGATVWLRLVEHLRTIRQPAALPGWLATTARRECLALLRSRKQQVPVDAECMADKAGPESDDWLLRQERHIALRVAFAGLPEPCQKLLSLMFSELRTPYAEIGTALGLPVGSIGPSRQRCLEKLRASPTLAALRDPPPDPEKR